MPLGLTVVLMMLVVIAVVGVLGYLMDSQVDRDEHKDDCLTSSADSQVDIHLTTRK
jgi:hypothetical protein